MSERLSSVAALVFVGGELLGLLGELLGLCSRQCLLLVQSSMC